MEIVQDVGRPTLTKRQYTDGRFNLKKKKEKKNETLKQDNKSPIFVMNCGRSNCYEHNSTMKY